MGARIRRARRAGSRASRSTVPTAAARARAALPDATALRLLGFEATLAGSQGTADVTVEIGDVGVDGADSCRGRPAARPMSTGDRRAVGDLAERAHPDSGATSARTSSPAPVLLGAPARRADPGASRRSARLPPAHRRGRRRRRGGGVVPAVPGRRRPRPPRRPRRPLPQRRVRRRRRRPRVPPRRWLAPDARGLAAALERERSTAFTVATRIDASSAPDPARRSPPLGRRGGRAPVLAHRPRRAGRGPRRAEVRRGRGAARARQPGAPAGARPVRRAGARHSGAAVIGIPVGAVAAFATARELARASVAGAPGRCPCRARRLAALGRRRSWRSWPLAGGSAPSPRHPFAVRPRDPACARRSA